MPTACPHIPAQFTIISHDVCPVSPEPLTQSTPFTTLPDLCIFVTLMPSLILAPFCLAPFASANAIFAGSPCPSFSRKTPPTTLSKLICGYFSNISLGEISSIPTSNALAIAADLLSSSIRSSVRATVIEPTRLNPVDTPVSSSSDP